MKAYYNIDNVEVGLDEAGRGSLAGPVFTASVILPKDFNDNWVKDSKKLTPKKRSEVYDIIKEVAVDWTISMVKPIIIDRVNITNATYYSMHECIDLLKTKPTHILVDGKYFKEYNGIPHTCIVGGDNEYYSIAAASILAKVTRDKYMVTLDKEYPKYGWGDNKGYGTKKHIEALLKHGPCEHHRKTFINKILNKNS